MSALGQLRPWAMSAVVAQLFGEQRERAFSQFVTEKMHGLARVTGDKVEILAVESLEPRQGHFREFIDRCKAEYRVVEVLEIIEPALNDVLRRYGFKKFSRRVDGEKVTGWRWKRKGDWL